MKTVNFSEVNEKVYYEKLDNKIDVYLYPTNKSKNFYCTFSTRYGSNVTSYKKGNKIIDVYPGTAHFLEHKLMNFTTNKEFFKRINKLGSVANAYTTYNVTNYNIYGSENIKENLSLIFDMVLNPIITDENVDNEKGIISEEIDMDKDNINTFLYLKNNQNIFNKLYTINHILGEKEDINKMNAKYLKMIYKDFYKPNNMFIIVVGNFDKDEIIEYIREYMKCFKSDETKIKINKIKEPDKVKVEYEIINKNISENRVYYSIKMNKKIYKDINDTELSYYLGVLLNANFSSTSKLYEKYKNNNLITNLRSDFKIFDNHIVFTIRSNVPNSDEYLNNLNKDILKLNIDEETFERKKKKILSEMILNFENIEDVEYEITNDILKYKHLNNKKYNIIKSLDYNKMIYILNKINYDNKSILICTK